MFAQLMIFPSPASPLEHEQLSGTAWSFSETGELTGGLNRSLMQSYPALQTCFKTWVIFNSEEIGFHSATGMLPRGPSVVLGVYVVLSTSSLRSTIVSVSWTEVPGRTTPVL